MAYLNSKMVMGYYRTPDIVVQRISNYIKAPDDAGLYHFLDPCCGEGLALADFRSALNVGKTFGIELDVERSEAAEGRLDRVLGCGYEHARVSKDAAGVELLWLNPPYDNDQTKAGRTELTFLRETQDWLRPGGILVYIVRRPHLGNRHLAKRLSSWFDDLSVYLFPHEDYNIFQQAVVFGVKREKSRSDSEQNKMLLAAGGEWGWRTTPRLSETPQRVYTLPVREAGTPWRFRMATVPPAEISAEAQRSGVWRSRFWQETQTPRPLLEGRPLMPLRLMHLAMYIASGLVNNALLDDGVDRLIVKGQIVKKKDDITTNEDKDKGIASRKMEFLQTSIWTTDLNSGKVQKFKQDEFRAFLERWRDALLAKIQADYPPLHELGDIAPWQRRVLNALMQGKRLPGRRQAGLLPVQMDAAAAALKSLNANSVASLIMATGTGKTLTSLAAAKILQVQQLRQNPHPARPFRVVIMTDEHLPEQWVEEIQAAIPMAYAQTGIRIGDVSAFMRLTGRLDPRTFCALVIPKSMAKLGSGWTPAYVKRGNHFYCPDCGSQITEKDESGEDLYPISDPAWFEDSKRYCRAEIEGDEEEDEDARICGAALWQTVRLKKYKPWFPTAGQGFAWLTGIQAGIRANPRPGEQAWKLAQVKAGFRWVRAEDATPDMNIREGYWSVWGSGGNPPTPRHPLADFIRENYSDGFDLFIADEAHRYNAAYSDQSYAYRALAWATGRTLELTATAFNGKASSLFYRQFIHLPALRRIYNWKDRDAFVAQYGLLEHVEYEEEEEEEDDGDDENGVYSGKRRRKKRPPKELPAVSPALLPTLLQTHIFLQLDDLGAVLPLYEQVGEKLELEEPVRGVYAEFDNDCKDALKRHPSGTGGWLQATLAYPNAPWNEEVVMAHEYNDEGFKVAFPIASASPSRDARDVSLLPKERWLLEMAQSRISARSGLGVYVQHVHGRGLPERLLWILEQAGINARIIPLSLKPARRNSWLKREWGKGMRVFITHPAKVETGMNLLDYPTLIFYQPTYSLITHIQAAGRAWRLGQRQDCETWFPYYADTMEHRALALMEKKVKANAVLTGSEDPADLVGETTSGDFMTELARSALRGAKVADLGVMLRRGQANAWGDEDLALTDEDEAFLQQVAQNAGSPIAAELAVDALRGAPLPALSGVNGARVEPLFGVQASLF